MVGAPVATPVTTPDVELTVAHAVLLLVQVPPGVASLNPSVKPVHTVLDPVMFAGSGLTVKGAVL